MTKVARLTTFALIAVLAPPLLAQDTVTYEGLRRLLERGFDQKEIVLLVNKGAVRVTEEQIEQLKAAGAGEALVRALREKISGDILEQLIQAAGAGKTEEEQIRLVMERGIRRTITAAEALRLMDTKVSDNAVRALEGKYVFPGFRAWRDPLGMLAMQLPAGWQAYHWYTGEGVKILLSPETGVERPNQFTTGLQIQVTVLHKDSAARKPGYDLLGAHKRDLPGLIALNRSYQLTPVAGDRGEPRATRVAGVAGVEQDFDVVMQKSPCRETLVIFAAQDMHFFTESVAPRDKFDALQETFRRMRLCLAVNPGRAAISRRRTRLEAAEALVLYREAVVAVRSEFGKLGTGFGSGFIVRDDGLVLTNHHVVCSRNDHTPCHDPSKMQLASRYTLLWDAKVAGARPGENHKTIEAKLVDTYYSAEPSVDIALLRIPPARKPYPVIPIVTTASGLVKELDPIIAMGFPAPSRLGIGNLVSTPGAVARVNYITRKFGKQGERRELNDLYHSAKINHGNSGGPCVSLDTGAVVGLNTYVPLNAQGENLEYSGTVLIDHILWHFPQIRWYPKRSQMSAQDHLELGAMLLAVGNRRSATVEFSAALEGRDTLDPEQRARLSYQLALLWSQLGDSTASARMLDECLAQFDQHRPALRDKAYSHAYRGEFDKATAFVDRLIRAAPDDYSAYLDRAEIHRLAKSPDDGLAAVQKALETGGQLDSWLHRVAGALHYQKNENEKGVGEYRQAVKLNPTDIDAHFGVLEYYERSGNANKLSAEYGRMIAAFPDDAAVNERYGRHLLKDAARFDDAVNHLSRSALIARERTGRARATVLETICGVTAKRKGYEDLCLASALMMHRDGGTPAWRQAAHRTLGTLMDAIGQKTLAALHQNAANVVVGAKASIATAAVDVSAVTAMMRAGYSGPLIAEVLADAGLGFIPNRELFAQLKQIMRADQANALVAQYLRDQLKGTYGLGRAVRLNWKTKTVDASGAEGPSDTVELHNVGGVPLTGIVVRRIYKDASKKVLWAKDDSLVLLTPVLNANEKRTIRFHYHSWKALAKHNITRQKIKYYEVHVMSARNAAYLQLMRVEGGYVKDKGFTFKLVNGSPFKVSKFVVRCDFVDKNGKTIYRANNQALFDLRTWNANLGPNQVTQPIAVPDWGNWDYIKKLGLPSGVGTVNHRAFVWEAVLDG